MRPLGIAVVTAFGAALVAATIALAGGIADHTCPNVAGEYTNTCPSGTVGTQYSLRFVESEGSGCGPGRQTFHLDSGTVPPGLTLAADGTLSGTPFQTGTYRFYVQMREPLNDPATCAGKRTEKQFTLRVRSPVSVVPPAERFLGTEVGSRLELLLRARGGTGIFAWRLESGRLPAGVRLTKRGSLLGAPRRAGVFVFTARAQDTEHRVHAWTGTLRVAERLRLLTEQVPAGRIGRGYRTALRAWGGVGPRRWEVTRGRLPRGLTLERTRGRLLGIPRESGTFRLTIGVQDGLRVRSTRAYVLTVLAARRAGDYAFVT